MRPGVGVTLVAALALTSCGGSPNESSTDEAPQPSASTSVPPSPESSAAPSPVIIDEDTGRPLEVVEVPVWDEASRASVVSAGVRAMELYARPKITQARWYGDLAVLMTDQAKADYAYVEPQAIAATAVSSGGVLVDDTSAYVGHVSVPTDVGVYAVMLIRQSATDPWLISKFTLPEGLH